MLNSLMFFMLGIKLEMHYSYYIVLGIYFGLSIIKMFWGGTKEDIEDKPDEDEEF